MDLEKYQTRLREDKHYLNLSYQLTKIASEEDMPMILNIKRGLERIVQQDQKMIEMLRKDEKLENHPFTRIKKYIVNLLGLNKKNNRESFKEIQNSEDQEAKMASMLMYRGYNEETANNVLDEYWKCLRSLNKLSLRQDVPWKAAVKDRRY